MYQKLEQQPSPQAPQQTLIALSLCIIYRDIRFFLLCRRQENEPNGREKKLFKVCTRLVFISILVDTPCECAIRNNGACRHQVIFPFIGLNYHCLNWITCFKGKFVIFTKKKMLPHFLYDLWGFFFGWCVYISKLQIWEYERRHA